MPPARGVARPAGVITSAANPRLRLVRRLQSRAQRARTGLFACEGEDLVGAALGAGLEPVDLLVAGESVAAELLASVSTLPHPARVIGVFRRADLPGLNAESGSLLQGVALWHVADPANVGALVRSADAFGAFVALSPGCGDPTAPKALRSSAGGLFRVPVGRFEDAPGRRVALAAHGGRPLGELELGPGTLFVLGAEREGLPEEVLRRCDEVATIPLPGGAESLNVAAAGAIALYEAARRYGTRAIQTVSSPPR